MPCYEVLKHASGLLHTMRSPFRSCCICTPRPTSISLFCKRAHPRLQLPPAEAPTFQQRPRSTLARAHHRTQATTPRPAATQQARRSMASDSDYMSFLDKANQDVSGGGAANTQSKGQFQFKATEAGAKAPKEIADAVQDAFLTSDADEPFEAVSLKFKEDSLPDEVQFAKLINHWDPDTADIEILDPTDWDRKGQYTKVIEAIRQATQGNDVRVYRVPKDATRAEYWIVSVSDGRVVGAKALSVES